MAFGELQDARALPTSAPQELGITTAVKDLATALIESASITENIRGSLGLSNPPTEIQGGKESTSLVSVLRGMTGRVYSTNNKLMEVLSHINA